MLKGFSVFFMSLFLVACASTNPPKPTQPTGDWYLLNTTKDEVKTRTHREQE